MSILKNHSFSKLEMADATKQSIELISMPAIFSFCLSFLSIISDKHVETLLAVAVEEFLQIIGIILTFYSSVFFAGLSMILIRFGFVRELLNWITASICKCGFNFTAVVVGVFLGLAIPVWIQTGSVNQFFGFLLLVLWFSGFQWTYYFISVLVHDEIKEPERSYFGINVQDLLIALGVIFVLISFFGIYTERWPGVFGA